MHNLAHLMVAIAIVFVPVSNADSAEQPATGAAAKVQFWRALTEEYKIGWVWGFRDSWPTAQLGILHLLGITSDDATNFVNTDRFQVCTLSKSNAQLAAMFDNWVERHPENWDQTLRTEFAIAMTSKEFCP
jgi:hypothetical protein